MLRRRWHASKPAFMRLGVSPRHGAAVRHVPCQAHVQTGFARAGVPRSFISPYAAFMPDGTRFRRSGGATWPTVCTLGCFAECSSADSANARAMTGPRHVAVRGNDLMVCEGRGKRSRFLLDRFKCCCACFAHAENLQNKRGTLAVTNVGHRQKTTKAEVRWGKRQLLRRGCRRSRKSDERALSAG